MSCKVSVIIPFFNGIEYLRECVESVQNQTLREIEILLVDDGSTDGSGDLADTFAASDTRIRVLHQENQGLSGARNTGIDAATGEYIGFVDADDLVAPKMYETLYHEAVSLSCEVVTCAYRSFFGERINDPVLPSFPMRERLTKAQIQDMMPQLNRDGSLAFVWRRLYAAALFREKSIRFDRRFRVCEDATFSMECFLCADGVAAIPESLYYYRYVESSLIRSKKYNSHMTDAMLLQYDVKTELGKKYMPDRETELAEAMALYTFRHISLVVFSNLFRKSGRGRYKEFRKVIHAPIFRDMYRFLDLDAFRSKSIDWVLFKCIQLHINIPAYCIGSHLYGKDRVTWMKQRRSRR